MNWVKEEQEVQELLNQNKRQMSQEAKEIKKLDSKKEEANLRNESQIKYLQAYHAFLVNHIEDLKRGADQIIEDIKQLSKNEEI